MKRNRILACSSLCGVMTLSAAVAFLAAPASSVKASEDTEPQTIALTGVVRDFIETNKPGGHPDFEVTPSLGFALYEKNIDQIIGVDGKPVFMGGGKKI